MQAAACSGFLWAGVTLPTGQDVVPAKGSLMNGAKAAESAGGETFRLPDLGPEVSGKEVEARGFPTGLGEGMGVTRMHPGWLRMQGLARRLWFWVRCPPWRGGQG